MEVAMIFIPIGLGVLCVLFAVLAKGQGRKAYDMQLTETAGAAELSRQAQEVAAEIGAGSFNKMTELKGLVDCDQPLRSEIADLPCVWYSSRVSREYEESYTERDADGKTRSGTRRGSEVVSSNERRCDFYVRDESGRVLVTPEGAAVEGERVLSRFEQGGGSTLTVGGFRLNLSALGAGRRTLGYKLEEWALCPGKQVYVLGEARDDDGRLRVAKPAQKGGRFIISVKSEEELVRAAKKGSLALNVLAGVCALGAVVCALLILTGVL
jgi:hypothetical protein